MGIFIHLDISRSITREEWEAVYNETLELIAKLPLAEKRIVKIHGVDTVCLVQTGEHEISSIWGEEEEKIGWAADGDMDTLKTAEVYFLPRDIIGDNEVDKNAGDAMLGAFPAYFTVNGETKRRESRIIFIYWQLPV